MLTCRRKLTVLASILVLLIFPSLAVAKGGAKYGVQSYDSASDSYVYGTAGSNYVMSAPTVDNMHVSSLYVHGGSYWGCEIGWFSYSDDIPKFFNSWMINGRYSEKIHENAPKNSNHAYQVENGIGTAWYHFYIDGVQKSAVDMQGFRSGDSVGSSERNVLTDTNYSHFWNLKWKDSSGTYSSWSNIAPYGAGDNDPQYDAQHVSNTEFYVLIP